MAGLALVVVVALVLARIFVRILSRYFYDAVLPTIYRHFPSALKLWGPGRQQLGEWLALRRAEDEGRAGDAVEAARRLLGLAERFSWRHVNIAVNALISAGKYRDALRLPTRWKEAVQRRGRYRDLSDYLLVQINLAEALYNLGRLGCATRLLEGITLECEQRGSRLVKAGLRQQKAWLGMLAGSPETALPQWRGVRERDLPQRFRAEWAFTHAAILRDLGDFDAAERRAKQGLAKAKRASSKRNALFLLGSIAARRGHAADAVALLEQGAAEPYRGQGAEGLLLLGDQYALLGREREQRAAYELAVERDPESWAARIAVRKLGQAARRSN